MNAGNPGTVKSRSLVAYTGVTSKALEGLGVTFRVPKNVPLRAFRF